MMIQQIIECYVATSYVALKAVKCTDPVSWHELHTLLPNLRELVSCKLCRKLDDNLTTCVGGLACSKCVKYNPGEDTTSALIQCYKKMCDLIHKSPIYDIMCSRHEDMVLVELITEAIGIPCPTNGHVDLPNGSIPSRVVKQGTKEVNNHNNVESKLTLDMKLPFENKTSNEYAMPQIIDSQCFKHKNKNQSVVNNYHKKKKNERRGCRCGNATSSPGKLTCFGQRCPCYTEQRPCGERCKCRGCRNPRQKNLNNDDNQKSDQMRRKPVTLELVSSLQPSNIIDNNTTYGSCPGSYIVRDVNVMQFPSHSRNFEQGGTEVTFGQVNSMFRSS